MHRVAITGLGIVSAAGTHCTAFFESLLAARSGIRSMNIAFPTGIESVLAGNIDFNPEEQFSRAKLLTMDRVSQFALVAAREAMAQAGLENVVNTNTPASWGTLARERFGVSLGGGFSFTRAGKGFFIVTDNSAGTTLGAKRGWTDR